MNKVLITGGSGFLGSTIISELVRSKIKPIVLLRRESDHSRIKNLLKQCNVCFEDESLDYIFKKQKPDTVIHTVCCYGRKNEKLEDIVQANIMFGIKIFDTAKNNNVAKFINIDTSLPTALNPYSLSKFQFKMWLQNFGDTMDILNCRFDFIYGENDDVNKFFFWFINKCLHTTEKIDLTPGNQYRDFIHVNDAARAIIKLNSIAVNGFKSVDVGTGEVYQMIDVINLLVRKIEVRFNINIQERLNWGAIPFRKNDFIHPNLEYKTLQTIPWKPQYNIEQGLELIINKFR
jgi:CDP-paratose synthetase